MEKWFCWGSVGVAGVLLLLFILDFVFYFLNLVNAAPFGGVSPFVDVLGAIACGLLLYLSIETMREQK